MIIQNRKSGISYNINKEQYERLVLSKMHTLFKIISKDELSGDLLRKNIPNEIMEFQHNMRIDPSSKKNVKPTTKAK